MVDPADDVPEDAEDDSHLLGPSSGRKTDDDILAEVEEAFPRIPVRFLEENKGRNLRVKSRDGKDGEGKRTQCAKLPQVSTLLVSRTK